VLVLTRDVKSAERWPEVLDMLRDMRTAVRAALLFRVGASGPTRWPGLLLVNTNAGREPDACLMNG